LTQSKNLADLTTTTRGDTMRERIIGLIKELLARKGVAVAAIDDTSSLHEGGVGLDSLDTAELSVVLEQELGHDPYSGGRFPATVGDLVAYYQDSPNR
jgi:acyl carrier protein